MNTRQFLISCWTLSPAVALLCAAALAGYVWAFRLNARAGCFAAFIGIILLALASPINSLADGYLFSAHMVQHILLLLVAPALLLLSLPRGFTEPRVIRAAVTPAAGWLAGVGAMWLWHAPALCNAAVTSKPVGAFQTISLLAMGSMFWWQVLAPREERRLSPLAGVIYLFTACTACTVLGIILTFSPVTVCSIYTHPVDRFAILGTIRQDWGISQQRDQQLGGLLMWVPSCLIFLSAVFCQLVRWFSPPAPVATALEHA